MNETTLEEAMEENGYNDPVNDAIWRGGVEFGVKWQSKIMYNEEEVLKLLQTFNDVCNLPNKSHQIKNFIEQFKKK